jgi:hypothetical protein
MEAVLNQLTIRSLRAQIEVMRHYSAALAVGFESIPSSVERTRVARRFSTVVKHLEALEMMLALIERQRSAGEEEAA